MATSQTPAGDDRNLVQVDETYAALGFEDRLRLFWAKYAKVVALLLAFILAVIVVRGLSQFLTARENAAIQEAYALSSTSDDLRTLISMSGNHPLGGAARLRLADEAYAAGDFQAATVMYQEAAPLLGANLLGARARLGGAMSLVMGGAGDDGQAALVAVADDVSLVSGVRAEAAYQLAVLARVAGRDGEARRRIEQVGTIDPAGFWAERAMMLSSQLDTQASIGVAGESLSDEVMSVTLPGN